MLFQDAALDSAQRYYHYLEKTGGGLIKTGVSRIEKDGEFYVLHLKRKLFFSDDAFVRVHNKDYSREQIHPVEYDENRRTLRVRPISAVSGELVDIHADDVCVVSDLKFLVKRVEEWYKNYGEKLRLPNKLPSISKHSFPDLQNQPSVDQNAAIEGVFSTPFSYVWGAPGTGKTRFVLARCILAYLLEDKKILITAPTNNAVDQMLYGVLAVLEEAGMPVDRVFRLGLASSEFVSRYPSVCEDIARVKRISSIEAQIKADEQQLSETEKLIAMWPDRDLYKEKINHFRECYASLLPLFDGLSAMREQKKELEDASALLKGEHIVVENQLKTCRIERERAVEKIRQLTYNIEKYNRGIRKLLWPKKYANSYRDLQNAMTDEARLQNAINARLQQLQSLKEKEQQHSDTIKKQQVTIIQHQEKILDLTKFWPELQAVARNTLECDDMMSEYPQMTELLESVSAKIHRIEKHCQILENTSEQELQNRKQTIMIEIEEQQKKLAQAEAYSVSARVEKCSVLAATVDRCIKDIPPDGDFKPDHVFLDEAGYCSLVKAAILTAYDCPLTFLGDHMQLPPVCEMNDDKMEDDNASIVLWAQSALYTEDALTKEVEQVYTDYLNHSAAHFSEMQKFNLMHTYRFGESLAKVLADDIYTEGFFGATNHDTEIFYIPVHRVPDEKKRVSSEECRAIVEYCRNTTERSIGIITPYTAQRDSLRRALDFDAAYADAVMTVHSSQGREWDVVLFSVVDTSDKWFTNSRNAKSNGKHVINTAVSRAKKKLILVCDADYWLTQPKQLIGKLLSVASEVVL